MWSPSSRAWWCFAAHGCAKRPRLLGSLHFLEVRGNTADRTPPHSEDLAAHGRTSTVWTIHHVIEAVDAGGVVAVSPPINIADPDGKLPADPLIVYDKLLEPVFDPAQLESFA